MPNTFQILTEFLERGDDEVEGRELCEPPDDLGVQLRKLARGDLAPTEQADLLNQLSRHPDWVARLAQEVKSLRAGSSPGQ